MFCQLFCDLPREYFDNDVIVDGLKKKSVVVLIYCIPLIYIYLFRNEYKEALDASIKINYQNIFRDIEQSFSHHEYSELICEAIYDHFSELCSTYEDIFTEFLILHYQTLNPKQILYYFQSSLKNTDQKMESCLLRYITKLYEERKDVIDHFDKNYRIDFATKYAKLLLKFRCSNTLDFIQNNQDFDGQVIQQIALQEKMYKELAFLSAKNGAAIYGLNVYINHIKSWNEAIYYAIQVNQEESYSLLIQESYHNKELLKCMIENLPMLQIDQEKFLREIPENEWCDEYSLLAQKALKEFQVRLSINKNILEIISKSSFHLFSNQINKSKRGHISKNNM
ncbi:hypothetical protein TRFO_32671 [Tritrichomonas foetus]|uniref:Uncharacterized protein n=1 Tax=Tritrichomonas foetus TaxID=1144522 RepID=A0A1J4JT14_9EUKA|nr:hypothetical protein TRFO_32671 [Tritrichomonas foetus]|eukprot:OHT00644.1 hypothetical protein TRFO_32671 [Tritrichomonas foetus]